MSRRARGVPVGETPRARESRERAELIDVEGWGAPLADASGRIAEMRARYIAETGPPPAHALGATVCAPGHRHRLTVVAYGMMSDRARGGSLAWPAYTLQDERDPSCQPFPAYRVPARDTKAHGWRSLLELSEGCSPAWLATRPNYLDACAHLHELARALPDGSAEQRAADETAADLLTEAAIRWWEKCGKCVDGTYTVTVTDLAMTAAVDASAIQGDIMEELRKRTTGNIARTRDADNGAILLSGPHKQCNGTGRVCRITGHVRLVEALIAAGLPARSSDMTLGKMYEGIEALNRGQHIGYRVIRATAIAEQNAVPHPWELTMGAAEVAALRLELRASDSFNEAPPRFGGALSVFGIEVRSGGSGYWMIGTVAPCSYCNEHHNSALGCPAYRDSVGSGRSG